MVQLTGRSSEMGSTLQTRQVARGSVDCGCFRYCSLFKFQVSAGPIRERNFPDLKITESIGMPLFLRKSQMKFRLGATAITFTRWLHWAV